MRKGESKDWEQGTTMHNVCSFEKVLRKRRRAERKRMKKLEEESWDEKSWEEHFTNCSKEHAVPDVPTPWPTNSRPQIAMKFSNALILCSTQLNYRMFVLFRNSEGHAKNLRFYGSMCPTKEFAQFRTLATGPNDAGSIHGSKTSMKPEVNSLEEREQYRIRITRKI